MSGVDPAAVGAAAGVVAMLFAVDAWRRNRHLDAQDRLLHKQDNKLDQQDQKLDDIHILVNSRLTEALDRIRALEEALHQATGIPKELIENIAIPPVDKPPVGKETPNVP